MTLPLISETSSTSEELQQKPDLSPTTSTIPKTSVLNPMFGTLPPTKPEMLLVPRPGMLLAGFVLLAALSSPSVTVPVENYFRRRDELTAESSTADIERDAELTKQVEKIFEGGASEFFEDGMYSQFSRSLIGLLTQYGRGALQAIAEYVFSGSGTAAVISEALRWLADFDDPATFPQRWAILQRTLKDHSPRVRDGAILGFAALDDPRARSLLLESQQSEPIPELRRLIQQVVEQLNATDAVTAPHR